MHLFACYYFNKCLPKESFLFFLLTFTFDSCYFVLPHPKVFRSPGYLCSVVLLKLLVIDRCVSLRNYQGSTFLVLKLGFFCTIHSFMSRHFSHCNKVFTSRWSSQWFNDHCCSDSFFCFDDQLIRCYLLLTH